MFRHTILLSLLAGTACHALVISGPNGTGTGNSTQSSLNSFISANALPAFPYWDNVISVSDSSGIYLGNSGSYGWVMTAAHVSALTVNVSTINVSGTPYTVRQSVALSPQDIRLYRIGGDLGDPVLPSLTNVNLASTSPGAGSAILSFGRGERVEGTLGSAVSSDAQLGANPTYYEWLGTGGTMRWGTNTSTVLPAWAGPPFTLATVGSTVNFFSIFDDPGSGNYLTALEAGFAVGDSGGPAFTVDGGVWKMSGWNMIVASDPGTGQPGSTTGFGNLLGYGNVATYRSNILAAMVPEVSTTALLALGLLGMLRRKRP